MFMVLPGLLSGKAIEAGLANGCLGELYPALLLPPNSDAGNGIPLGSRLLLPKTLGLGVPDKEGGCKLISGTGV